MIVIGTDTHKRTHTCGAVFADTGQLAGELTAPAREPGFRQLLDWGRELDSERVWALEDCRHVSGSLERFLIATPNYWEADQWGSIGIGVPEILMGLGFMGLFVACYRLFLQRFPVIPSPVALNAIPNGLVTFSRPSRSTVAEA